MSKASLSQATEREPTSQPLALRPKQAAQMLGIGRLVALCRELQRNAGNKPFFITYRTIEELLGIDRNRAGRYMTMLCADGVLDLQKKGHTGRASEYRYRDD